MSDTPPHGLEPTSDARNVATPTVSEAGFPPPPAIPIKPGIGSPWLGLPAAGYKPEPGLDPDHPHVFHLQSAPGNFMPGGSLQGAHAENFPILRGQKASTYLIHLAPGGIREPHWHPSAWEVNFVIAGTTRWSFVGPDSTQDRFTVGAGDLVFAPQGHFHYFENVSDTEDLYVLVVFNAETTEPQDDVPLAQSISSVPADVLGAVFGVDPSVFAQLPVIKHRKPVVQKPGFGDGR
ncbi:cupin domain-containing protein [Mycolicibacterium cosmeticum]|uniref:cupin domain-containing protein n=1 Tax=Mycolicibacterium cosmeticum TaxID=258533 RepID=UPI003204D178